MNPICKPLLFAAALAACASSFAAGQIAAEPAGSTGPAAATADPAGYTDGEVRKVDKSAGKITVRHGAIRNLDMPPMTMVFHVADATMLDQVKAGDKVRFRAADDGGQLTITEIQPAP